MNWKTIAANLLGRFVRRRSDRPQPPVSPQPPPPVSPPAGTLLDAINDFRVVMGRQPLNRSAAADRLAQAHADDMARAGRIGHDGWSSRAAALGGNAAENVALNRGRPADVVAAWAESRSGHREAMLGDFGLCGVGVAGDCWCAIFHG